MTEESTDAAHTAETVRPPPEACCGRCGGVLIGAYPCGCDLVKRALHQLDGLLVTLASMDPEERRAFLAQSADRIDRVFGVDRESRV